MATLLRLRLTNKFPFYVNNVVNPIIVRTCTQQLNSSTPAWDPIYNFPSINFFAAISKLKNYQSALTAVGVPVLMGLEMSQIVSQQSVELFAVLGITGTVTLCIYSFVSTNVIGFVYVNRELRKIRFSYMDFWGSRKNEDLTLDDLVSCNEKLMFNNCMVIKTKTAVGSFKLFRFGDIQDPEVFQMIFGDI